MAMNSRSLRPPLGSVTRDLDAPAKVQKANAGAGLPKITNAITVTVPKKKGKPPMRESLSNMMLAGGKNG